MKPLAPLALASALLFAACNSAPTPSPAPVAAATPSAPSPAALPVQAGHGTDGKRSSSTIAWKHKGSHDYEKQYPGMGYSRRFECNEGWLDLYEYDAGNPFWSDNLEDPAFKSLYQAVLAEVLTSSKRQGECKITREEKVRVGDMTLLHTEFELTMRERRTESHLYLAPLGGRIIKFRVSLSVPGEENIRQSWMELISSQLERIQTELKDEARKFPPDKLQLSIMIQPPGPVPERDAVWLGYAAARLEYLEKQAIKLRRPSQNVFSSFGEELHARQTALKIYGELQEKNTTFKDPYWEALKQIQMAGFLRHYVWLCHRAPFWGPDMAPPELERALAWIKEKLPDFKPTTEAAIFINECQKQEATAAKKP